MDRSYFRPVRGDSRASRHRQFKKLLKTLRDCGTSSVEAEISKPQSTCSTYSWNTLLENQTTSTSTEFLEIEPKDHSTSVPIIRDTQDSSDTESEMDQSMLSVS